MNLKNLLKKSLLVAVGLCAGVTSAWATTDDYGIDLDAFDKTTYDFTTMNGTSLTIDNTGTSYSVWTTKNKTGMTVYPCTTFGMTRFAFEEVGGDAWQFYNENGLCTYARFYSGAVTGLKTGNIVVFVYTMPGKVYFGNTAENVGPYTLGDEVTVNAQTTLYDGRYYRKATMTSDGIVGFYMNKWSSSANSGFIRQIHVYTAKGVCAEPTYRITGANKNARTFELDCSTDASTIYYSTSELATATGGTEYTAPVETEATTIWAYAKTSSSTSDVISFSTGAGSYENLSGATFSNPYYDIASGKWCVKVSDNQNSVTGKPTATLQYYTTDEDSKTDCTSGNIISGFDFGATVHVVASAANYASTIADYTFPASLAVGDRIATWTDDFTSGEALTFGSNETMGNVTCAPITSIGSTILSGNFGLNGNNNWSSNTTGITTGNNYYTGAKNLSTSGLLKIVVNENTFMNGLITGRKSTSLNYAEKNTDGTYSMYFNIEAAHICFNGKGGQTILSVSFMNSVSKSITSAGWATYCSPYALDLANATGLTDAYIVTGGTDGVLAKTSVKSTTVPANTGLLLKGDAGTATIPVVASSSTDVDDNILVGKTAAEKIEAGTGWVLMGTPSLGFYQNKKAFTVGANTAYIPVASLPVPAGTAPAFFSLLDGETTGINTVKASEFTVNGEYYNLAGQRVAQPTKGLYIVNGKKVIVK